VSSGATKKGKACCQDSADTPVDLLSGLSKFQRKSGAVDFFCSEEEPFALSRARVVVFLLGIEEPLPDLLSDLLEFVIVFRLVSRRSGSLGFMGEVLFFIPVLRIDSLDEFSESCEGVAYHGGPYRL